MSEQRFYITDTGLGLDTESDEMYSFGDEEDFCRLFDKLNEQQSTIESERDLFEKYKASAIRDMRDYSDKIIEMQKKVDEQQATIRKLQDLCGESDSENAKLRIENEQLRQKLDFYLLDEFEWKEKYGD